MTPGTEPFFIHRKTADILAGWLKDVGFDLKQKLQPFPAELYHELRVWILSQNLQHHQAAALLKLLPTCTSAADQWYPQASFLEKRYIALFTTFLLYVDDRAEKDIQGVLPDLQTVVSKARMGFQSTSCQDAVIALWLDLVVTETEKFFGPYATGVITKGFVDFMLGNMVEASLAKSLTIPPNSASRSSQFIRDKTGAGEVYAHFLLPESLIKESDSLQAYIQCVRPIIDIIDHVNDILSFFKESVVGTDENTHIMNLSRAGHCSPEDILKKICCEMAEAMGVVSDALEDVPVIREIWNEFVNGYIMWHICHDRYRLKEIGIAIQ